MTPFAKITKKAAAAALLSVAIIANAQEAPVNNVSSGPSVLDIAVNVIVPTAVGAGIAVLTKGNGWVGAGIGAGVGVAKSIYDEVSANQKANNVQPPQVNNSNNNQANLQKTSYNQNPALGGQPLQTVPITSLVDRYGNLPHPAIQKESNGDIIIAGNNPREIMYGMGMYLSTAYNYRVDLTTKAVRDINLMSDYTANSRTAVRFSGNSLQSAIQALGKVDTMCAQSAMIEESTKYVVVANRQTVKDMLASPVLKAATQNGGITVDDVNNFLATYQPVVQPTNQPTVYQQPLPPPVNPYAQKTFIGIRY